MNKKLQGIIIGLIAGSVITGSIATAKNSSDFIEAVYNNIRIFVNNTEIEPKDANGNAVEPFISNGTTYLPVRAVSEALGKKVSWDGNTNSVYISDNHSLALGDNICGYYINVDYLDKIHITKSAVDSQAEGVSLMIRKDEITGSYMLMQGDMHQGGDSVKLLNIEENNGIYKFNFESLGSEIPTVLTYDESLRHFSYSGAFFGQPEVIEDMFVKFDDGRDACEYIAYTILRNSPEVTVEDEKVYTELNGEKKLILIPSDATMEGNYNAMGYIQLASPDSNAELPYYYYNIENDNFIIKDEDGNIIKTIKL